MFGFKKRRPQPAAPTPATAEQAARQAAGQAPQAAAAPAQLRIDKRTDAAATAHLVEIAALRARPFTLIDVGCSGGIAQQWRAFGEGLRAHGLDAMVGEVERLRASETFPDVHYHARRVGLPDDHPMMRARGERDPWGRNPWDRLSIKPAMDQMAARQPDDETKVKLNLWDHTTLADKSTLVGVSEFVAEQKLDDVDFIKIDIDSFDLFALVSCEDVLESHRVLGFLLEVNYYGTDDETDHTFHNMDRFMRRQGYDLFDLTVRRYSRTALPAMFEGASPGQTDWGIPLQGDALYVRDWAHPDQRGQAVELAPEKLLKLMSIYELYGLPDCAAEIIDTFGEQIASLADPTALLDRLTPRVDGREISYADYRRLFAEHVDRFFRRPSP